MAFQGMFGAGVNGLFSGMSDAMKLYAMYQGIEQTQAGIDNADKVRQAMQDDAAKQQPAGSADQNIWGGGVNPGDTNDPGSNIDKPDPNADPAKPSEGVKTLAGAGTTPKKPLDTIGPAPGVTPETKTDTGAALTPNAPITSPSPAAGAAAASGLQSRTGPVAASTNPPEGTPPEEQGPPASAKQTRDQAAEQRWNAWVKAGGTVADWLASGGSPGAVAGHGVSAGADPTGGAAPAVSTPPVPTPAPATTGPGAIGSGTSPLTGTATLPLGQGQQTLPPTAPAGPALTPAPALEPGAVPAPGARPRLRLTPQTPPPPAPNYDPNQPTPGNMGAVTNRPVGAALHDLVTGQQTPNQPSRVTPAPTTPAGTPQQTSDAGPSIGSRILSAFNPMGSAQAAELTPGQGQGPGPGQGQSQPSSTPAATDNGPAAPAPAAAVGPGSKPAVPSTPAPATAPAAQQPAQQQTGPTTTDKPVAPAQQGATQTSEAPPQVRAPEFDHRPYMLLQRDHPDEYALVNKIAGEEHANPAQLALLWHLESNMQPTSITSAKGAVGPLQILPSTARMVDPKGEEDITTLKGGLTIAARLQHMIIEPKFGVGTPSSFIAYQGGNGSADDAAKMSWAEFQASHKDGAKYLTDAYGSQPLAQGMFTPDGSVNMKQFVDAGIQRGPNGALEALVETGPAGMSMSNLWKQAEISGVYAALMRGDQQGAMAARDFVFQMSHAGATANLMAADKALLSGDGQGAAQYLAKAHAFFPDGTYGQFGVDKAGQVWGQRFDETTGKPLAQPFQVTHEGLATQLIETRDPNKYRELVNKEQQNAADLRLKAAHEDYYYNQPTARTQAAALRANTQLQIESQREIARQGIAAQHDDTVRRGQDLKAGDDHAFARQVDTENHNLYTPDSTGSYRSPGVDASNAGNQGEIYTALRRSDQGGGNHLSSSLAQNLAGIISSGGMSYQFGADGSVALVDPKSSARRAYISPDQVSRLIGLGLIKPPQGQAPAPGQSAAPQAPGQRAAVGGGAGSYQVAASGGGTNLANQPYQMPQPAQAIG